MITVSTTNEKTWDLRFLDVTELVASWSKDPDCKVGAVIVADRRIISTGYNGFVAGDSDWYGCTKEEKLERTIHAELNAILNAGQPVDGFKLYTTKAPCFRCCVYIAQAGISSVHTKAISISGRTWFDSQTRGKAYLEDIGIKYRTLADL